MEIVREESVKRYQKLRTEDGEDGEVDGCAICRDDLLDKSLEEDLEAERIHQIYAALPFHPPDDCVLAFPCTGKHLFHRDCLFPWLSRKTTCPSCRFDIDPLSLTLRLSHGAARDMTAEEPSVPPRVWRPPQVESLGDWLDAEERARATGKARVRPPVVMPECKSSFREKRV